jgi:hypothetical protein
MADDLIRYDLLVQDALRGVVRKVLTDAAREGLLGEHHFYVSFRTEAPGVRMSQALREKYPQDMTIVLQHQFWDLNVTEHAFEVGLSFSGVPNAAPAKAGPRGAGSEPGEVRPKSAGLATIGAGAPKGLPAPAASGEKDAGKADDKAPRPAAKKDGEEGSAEVVSLDAFRKKS